MTTPERKTPEQAIDAGARIIHGNYREEPWGDYGDAVWARGTFRAALRAAGLLGGDPTEEQIERALEALSRFNEWTDNPRGAMRAALTAAGVTPQADPDHTARHTHPAFECGMHCEGFETGETPEEPSEYPECDGCEEMGPEDERCPRHGVSHAGLWAEIDRLRSLVAPQEHVNSVAMSEERVKNQADSFHVAPQKSR